MSPGMPVPSPQAAAAPGWSGQIALEARTARPPSAHTHLMQPRRSLRQRPSPPPLRRPRRRPRRVRSRCRRWPPPPAGGGVSRPPGGPGNTVNPRLPAAQHPPRAPSSLRRRPSPPPLRRPRRRPRRARSRCRRWPTAPAGGGVGRPPWRPGQHSEPGLPRPSNTPLVHAATTAAAATAAASGRPGGQAAAKEGRTPG